MTVHLNGSSTIAMSVDIMARTGAKEINLVATLAIFVAILGVGLMIVTGEGINTWDKITKFGGNIQDAVLGNFGGNEGDGTPRTDCPAGCGQPSDCVLSAEGTCEIGRCCYTDCSELSDEQCQESDECDC